MKNILLMILPFLLPYYAVLGQGSISTYNQLYNQFYEAKTLEAAEPVVQRMTTYTCVVGFYPQLLSLAIEEKNREKAVYYLHQSFLYGLHKNTVLNQGSESSAKEFLSPLTIDSLWQKVGQERCPPFHWQKQMEMSDILSARALTRGVAFEDSNASVLAQPLRNLMYTYLRHNPFPQDCETGVGTNTQARLLIMQYARFLHDFEFEELHQNMRKAVETFSMPREFMVAVVDRYYSRLDGSSIYGTTSDYFVQDPQAYIAQHKEEINANRKEVGLDPLK